MAGETLLPAKHLARISHKEMEKGCCFWHNSFVEKKLCREGATAL
jgi:hypothetical protein